MEQLNIELLKNISDSFSVLSNEHDRIDFLKSTFEKRGISASLDAYHNLLVGNLDSPKIVVAAHVDEVGVMVKDITPDGLISIVTVGYIHPIMLLNSKIVFKTSSGMVDGYVLSPRMFGGKLGDSGLQLSDLLIDIGATNKEDVAKRGIEIGVLGTYEKVFRDLGETVIATGIDNGIGIYLAASLVISQPTLLDKSVFVFHRGEENGSIGARTFTNKISAEYALVLDYFPAKIGNGVSGNDVYPSLGSGPSVLYGAKNYVIDAKLLNKLKQVKILHQPCFINDKGDSEVPHFQTRGSLGVNIGVPARGFHGAAYIVDKGDIQETYCFVEELIQVLSN